MKTKKLNRGLIFTGFVLLCVAAYLTVTTIQRANEKPVISAFLQSVISTEVETLLLPDEYMKTPEKMSQEEFDRLTETYKEKLKPFFAEDGNSNFEDVAHKHSDCINAQNDGSIPVLTILVKTISQISDIKYSGDEINVSVYENVSFGSGANTQESKITENFILRKNSETNEYEIVFAGFNTDFFVGDEYSGAKENSWKLY